MKISKVKVFLIGLPALLGMAMVGMYSMPLADLRNDKLKQGITETMIKRGKKLLNSSAEAHGLKEYKKLTTIEFDFKENWNGLMGTMMRPWPENNQKIRMKSLLRTFTSNIEFLEGKGKGEIWGIQAWSTYKKNDKNSKIHFENDGTVEFFLPTAQYFTELPFRVTQADIIAYMGEKTVNNKKYRLVFATWGSVKPNKKFDQYVIYINKESSLIEKMTYTVRDMMGFMQATVHFDNYKSTQGVTMPSKMTWTMDAPPDVDYDVDTKNLHQMIVSQVKYDSFSKTELEVTNGLASSSAKQEH